MKPIGAATLSDVALLSVRNVSMQFPAVLALDSVNLEFSPGVVHGIIGENGAGKSTLMRIFAGLQKPTSGEIFLDDAPVRFDSPKAAVDHGIAMIHQELNLVDDLSVSANLFLGRETTKFGMLDDSQMNSDAEKILARVGATIDPQTMVGQLPLVQKQLVEIAKAVGQNARVLIMDEPTAVLSDAETRQLFSLINELKSQWTAILYISHRLIELEEICDVVTVMRDGKVVKTLDRAEVNRAELARLMVGRELRDVFPEKQPPSTASTNFVFNEISDSGRIHGVSLSLSGGEVVGLAGLMGSGRTEFGETIAGHRKMTRGTVKKNGQEIFSKDSSQAIRNGIAYVSEDRKALGLHLGLNQIDNTTLANLKSYGTLWMDASKQMETTQEWTKRLDVRVGDSLAPVGLLSGGNQQKVSVSKWLDTRPELLILDEPTRGIDVGAKREFYELIHNLARDGMACLVISSELPELIGLCHRIVVMREGRKVGEVHGESATEEAIMRLAAGVDA